MSKDTNGVGEALCLQINVSSLQCIEGTFSSKYICPVVRSIDGFCYQ